MMLVEWHISINVSYYSSSAILAVNVISGILEPAKRQLTKLCMVPADTEIEWKEIDSRKMKKREKRRKKKKKKKQ